MVCPNSLELFISINLTPSPSSSKSASSNMLPAATVERAGVEMIETILVEPSRPNIQLVQMHVYSVKVGGAICSVGIHIAGKVPLTTHITSCTCSACAINSGKVIAGLRIKAPIHIVIRNVCSVDVVVVIIVSI